MVTNQINPTRMYTLVKGESRDNTRKSIELEGDRLYVYKSYLPQGVYFSVSKAIKKFNSL